MGGEGKATSMAKVPRYLIELARELRKNATPPEEIMWACLRDRQLLGAKFRRQHPVGRYIVDFCCLHHRLVIELDGSVHATQLGYDRERQLDLEARHFTVLRFSNDQVEQDLEATLEAIATYL